MGVVAIGVSILGTVLSGTVMLMSSSSFMGYLRPLLYVLFLTFSLHC